MSETPQLPLFHIVGFSGHRSVANPEGVARAISAELEALRREAPGEWLALSSVADGSDQVFVAQARALGFSWHAILPLPWVDFATDFPPEERVAVEGLLAQAEHVRVNMENGTREDAYLDCGMETVNGADVLLAVWDGQPARGKGGTADVVAYARSLEKPVVIIDPATLAVQRENFERLRREDEHLAKLNRLPASDGGWGENPFGAPDHIFRFQRKCDHAASRGAPYFRRLIVGTVILHVVATLVAAAGLAFDLHYSALPWLKLLCLTGAIAVALLLRRHHHSMHNWVGCRLAAEFCRSALATWGLPRTTSLFEDVDVPNARGLARALHILHSRAQQTHAITPAQFRDTYRAKRIDDQLAYYRRQEARALPLFGRLKLGFWIATLLALACTAAYALGGALGVTVPGGVKSTIFYLLPLALPVIAAAFISLISINDLHRRVARYREMQVMLEDSRRRLGFCETWNSLERVVLKTERALRQEMLEWHSITSFTESH
ncbi:MAG: hypothetical protein JNL39_10730 [Opitutaceae bacterium]|nr:hypothetical protein [Opitutaceae bacterium]